MLKPGQPAPDFLLPDSDGNPTRLADFRGKWIALWFFPWAGTPG